MKTIEEKYKKLDDIEHCLTRPARYIGSINPHTAETYVYQNNKFIKEEITWCPGLLKVFDEIISNSVDFSKTSEGKHLTTIKVEIDKETGELSVHDNGGIVVVKHKEHNQYIPEMIFELKAGSNFNDDDGDDANLTGQNGEGAALTVIFSKQFKVHTADGQNQFKQTHLENARKKTEPKITSSDKNFTHISWIPDYEKFNLTGLDEGNYKRLVKRVYDVAGCNPQLKVYLNGSHIKINSFKDYVEFYVDDFAFDENDKWKIGVSSAKDGFEHISFVNGTETSVGGTHINYVADQIVNKLKEFFKKKHKVDVKPSDIKNHLQLFIDASIVKPRYNSQTKDMLVTEPKMYLTSWECSDKLVKKIITLDAIQNILDWVKAKEQANLAAELRKHNKNVDKSDPKNVPNFYDATNKKRHENMLLICEGQSAMGGILSGRDTKYHGVFPLRGKPINVYDMEIKDVIENKEFKNIMTITGLQLGVPVKSIDQLYFGKIGICTDADSDAQHIKALLMNTFYKYWPELFDLGIITVFDTPIVKVNYKKEVLYFYSHDDFNNWANEHKNEKYEQKHLKGLGSSKNSDWKTYFSKEVMENCVKQVIMADEDKKYFELLFSKKNADQRKGWLDLEEK